MTLRFANWAVQWRWKRFLLDSLANALYGHVILGIRPFYFCSFKSLCNVTLWLSFEHLFQSFLRILEILKILLANEPRSLLVQKESNCFCRVGTNQQNELKSFQRISWKTMLFSKQFGTLKGLLLLLESHFLYTTKLKHTSCGNICFAP